MKIKFKRKNREKGYSINSNPLFVYKEESGITT